jgi:tetratricopeptide (TPR) repeat protein
LARRRVAEAESILVALLGADPKNVEAQLVLADLLAETGRLAEAALCFERALAIAPWQTTAYSGLFSSKRMTERDRPLITQAAAQLGSAGLADRQRMALRFALGKAEEDLGNYGEAMQHWDEANAIRSTFAPFDRAKWTAWVDRIIATFPPSSFEAYDGDRSEDSTPILVLGMPRSGTTLLERILSSHAEVAGGGELTFWESNGPQALASLSYEAERRDAVQFRLDRPRPRALPERPNRPREAKRDRHLPVHLYDLLRERLGLRERSGQSRILLPRV